MCENTEQNNHHTEDTNTPPKHNLRIQRKDPKFLLLPNERKGFCCWPTKRYTGRIFVVGQQVSTLQHHPTEKERMRRLNLAKHQLFDVQRSTRELEFKKKPKIWWCIPRTLDVFSEDETARSLRKPTSTLENKTTCWRWNFLGQIERKEICKTETDKYMRNKKLANSGLWVWPDLCKGYANNK